MNEKSPIRDFLISLANNVRITNRISISDVDKYVISTLYLVWVGTGFGIYISYPSTTKILFIFFSGISFTVVAVLILVDLANLSRSAQERELNLNHLRSQTGDLHMFCTSPNEICARCTGFYWSFSLGAIVAIIIGYAAVLELISISGFFPDIPFFSSAIIIVGFFTFLLSTVGHGIVNSAMKRGYIPDHTWVESNLVKVCLGVIAGTSVPVSAIGVLSLI